MSKGGADKESRAQKLEVTDTRLSPAISRG